jgi:hypothetical protein
LRGYPKASEARHYNGQLGSGENNPSFYLIKLTGKIRGFIIPAITATEISRAFPLAL